MLRGFSSSYGRGIEAFLFGLATLVALEFDKFEWWMLSAAWLANPAICIAVIAIGFGRWRVGAFAASYGLAFWLAVLFCFGDVVAEHPAYWTWGASAVFLLVSAIVVLCRAVHVSEIES